MILRPGEVDAAATSLLLVSKLLERLTFTGQVPARFWVPGATIAVTWKAEVC